MKQKYFFLLSTLVISLFGFAQTTTLPYNDDFYTDGYPSVTLNNFSTCQVSASITADSGQWDGATWSAGGYSVIVNGVNIGSFTGLQTIDISSYLPITSVQMSSNWWFWSWVDLTVNITSNDTSMPATGPTVSNITYVEGSTASPLTAGLNSTGTTLKWYTDQYGDNYSATAPTPSTATVGTTSYFVSQADASGCESERSEIVVTVVAANSGTHLNFDGFNDNVAIPAPSINNLTQGTIEAWIYPTAGTLDNQTICAKQSNSENTYAFLSIGGGSAANGRVNYQSTNSASIQSNSTIFSNQWTHIAVAFTSTQAKIYINGFLDNTVTGSFSLPNDTTVTATTIGAILGDGNGQYFTGSIDEFRIWNTARTIEQINGSMNCELQGNETNLLTYYNFNQGIDQADNSAITTLDDITSNGYDGTLTNFTLNGATSNWLMGSPVTIGSAIPSAASVTSPVNYNQGDTASALSATTGSGGTGLLWYTSATGGTGSTSAPTPSTATPGSTSYWVSSTNANYCESERVEIVVNVTSLPATHLNFDGSNDYVDCGSILPASYTKEAWIYFSNSGLQNNFISGGDADGQHALWAPSTYGNRLSAGHNATWNAVQDPTPLALNTWYHIAVTYDAATTTMNLYKNGVLVSTNSSVPAYASGNTVRLGAYNNANNLLNGNLEEVRIWNTVRTTEQIAGAMNCELQGNETGLLAYYNFNQGIDQANNSTETTLTDITSNGYNGTLTNFALTGATSNWLAGSPVETGSSIPSTPSVTTPVTYNQGDSASALSATTGSGGTGLLWYTSATGGSGSTSAPTPSTASGGTTSYWVSSTNANGCESERVEIVVNVNAEATHLNFDGASDRITGTNPNLPQGNSPRTIEAWVRNSTGNDMTIFNYGNINVATNQIYTLHLYNGVYIIGYFNDINTGYNINDGNWHHVAVSHDGTNSRIYVDGVLINTTSITYNTNGYDFQIGASNRNGSYLYNLSGSLDEIRVWNVALSQTDIQDTMNCELAGGQNNVVAYYKFNQGFDTADNTSFTTLTDSSVNGNDGTLTNFALTGTTSNWQLGSAVTTGNTCSPILSNSNFETNKFTIYPNPSAGIFNLSTQEDVSIEVYDLLGKVIAKQNMSIGTSTINISNYSSGIYLLKVTNTSGSANTYKIIKR